MTMPCRLWHVDTITKTNNRLAAPSTSLINWREHEQQWADYLDEIKAGAKVVPFKQA